ncbi:MAG: OmpA family protein [Prevotellaceae bacterium]|nr:OmpA family protein [Prevotellaceae bacterium]
MKTIKIAFSAFALLAAGCASQNIISEEAKKTYMKNVYTLLVHEISNDAEVTIVEDSIKVIFTSGILFNVNETIIAKELYPCFKRFADALNKYENTKILITGHTDNTGDEQINVELSQKRADSTKKLLHEFNVLESRMFTLGHGSAIPVCDNASAQGRSKNRRVEFVILYNYTTNKK